MDSSGKSAGAKIEWTGRVLEVIHSHSSLTGKVLGVTGLLLLKSAELVTSIPFRILGSKISTKISTASRLSQMQIVAHITGSEGSTSDELVQECASAIDEILEKKRL